jgi:hypothetical protein
MHIRDTKLIETFSQKTQREEIILGDLGIVELIILKCILKKKGARV